MQQMLVFPKIQNFDEILDAVKSAGENARLHFLNVTPSSPIQTDFYDEVPVQMTLVGTYQHILDFMQTTFTWSGPLFIWKNWTLSHQSKPKTTVLNDTENQDFLQMNVNTVFFTLP
jgi:Tfp pilus assembly protein PilO